MTYTKTKNYPYPPTNFGSLDDVRQYLISLRTALFEADLGYSEQTQTEFTDPEFESLTLSDLTASRPVITDASKTLASIAYTGATSFRANLSLEPTDSPTFTGLTLSGLTAGRVVYVGVGSLLTDSPIYSSAADVGIGVAQSAGIRLRVQASASCEATLGAQMLTNGDFATNDLTGWTAAAGWSAATGKAVHNGAIGDTTPLTQNVNLVNGNVYQVTVTTSARTAGTLTLTFGALVGSYAVSANTTYDYTFTATATAAVALTFTPTATYDGAVDDVFVRLVTANATPMLDILDTGGVSACPIRVSGTLENFGMGVDSLMFNTTGHRNSAQGSFALYANTTGYENSAQGYGALYANTTGHGNSAQGYGALYANTTGHGNSAQGSYALRLNTTGHRNSAQGSYALCANTTGHRNSAQGYGALCANTTGYRMIGVGYYAGYGATTANAPATDTYGILIGYNANRSVVSATVLSNYIGIGYQTLIGKSNQVILGNTSILETRLYGNLALHSTGNPHDQIFGDDAVNVWGQWNGTAPTTSPADCYQMWSEDGIPHIRTEENDVIRLDGYGYKINGVNIISKITVHEGDVITNNGEVVLCI